MRRHVVVAGFSLRIGWIVDVKRNLKVATTSANSPAPSSQCYAQVTGSQGPDRLALRMRPAMNSTWSASASLAWLGAMLVLTGPLAPLAGAQELKPQKLTGKVVDARGEPIPDAAVFIYTAGPKTGVSVLCPSCYADCRKRARTDSAGAFQIEALDPSLLFRVLVAKAGHQADFVSKVDPAAGPIEVRLKMVTRSSENPKCSISGRILLPNGQPMEGAVITPAGVSTGDGTRWGAQEDMESLVVSDGRGRFSLFSSKPFDRVTFLVEARGFAKRYFNDLKSGTKPHDLTLTEGATVSGRLVKDGKPLSGIEVGLCGVDREAGKFIGDFTVATERDGRFMFVNIPPNTDCFIYGKMQSLASQGSVPARRLRTGGDGAVQSIGDLKVVTASNVSGRVMLSDGKPVPPDTQVMLTRKETWDVKWLVADAKGRFVFSGVPDEMVRVHVRLKGYHPAAPNARLGNPGPSGELGRITSDRDGLVLLLEPDGP